LVFINHNKIQENAHYGINISEAIYARSSILNSSAFTEGKPIKVLKDRSTIHPNAIT
jgi:hypothetical protein